MTGQRPEYGATATITATRTNTAVKDIPQALTVISERQIEDQALRSIAAAISLSARFLVAVSARAMTRAAARDGLHSGGNQRHGISH